MNTVKRCKIEGWGAKPNVWASANGSDFFFDGGNISPKAFQAAKCESPVLTSPIEAVTQVVDSAQRG